MTITRAAIRGFRCFDRYDIELDEHCTVITGPNASGKTSLLEAFHVASRLRSFRTTTTTDLIKEGAAAFSVRLFTHEDEIHVAYGADTHLAEINGTGPATRSRLMQTVSLVTITEQDLDLVQGSPEGRRNFLDQASIAHYGIEAEKNLRRYYQIHRQRTALLNDPARWNKSSYEIITEQAWQAAATVRATRTKTMALLEAEISTLLVETTPGLSCSFQYEPVLAESDISGPEQWCKEKEQEERRMKRSLMGIHLDDMGIIIQGKMARRFASRGMQKMIAVLMRVAQAKLLPQKGTLLLDDLLADFDEERLQKIMHTLVKTGLQLVFTAPAAQVNSLAYRPAFPSTAHWIHLPSY